MTNYILLKFISQKSYVDDFLNGSLYMNSLYYFWNEYPLKEAAAKRDEYINAHPEVDPENVTIPIDYKLSPAQADMFEGTIGFDTSNILKMDFGEHRLTDAIMRAVGFQYCNSLCFYRLDYVLDGMFIHYDVPNMKDFGDYVAIIKDKNKLLQRVNVAAKRESIDYLCGDVHYRGLKLEGKDTDVSTRHHIVLKCDALFDMADFNLKSKRDCFVKMDRYAWQKEWRIAAYRGMKDTNAYRLEIGDIRDIAECVPAEDLASTIDRLFRSGKIKTYDEGYYGNISRQDLKEKFYQLGDNKAEMFCFIG
jgi:hypothetical protein